MSPKVCLRGDHPIFCEAKNGAGEIRTRDPLLAKQVLCQLSYDPVAVGLGKEQGSRSFLLNENYFVRSTETQIDTQDLATLRTILRPSE
jgi:hypothetical protein